MIRKTLELESKVLHTIYGIGTFKGWWLERPEYARVEYLLENEPGNLLIPRKDLIEIEKEV